MRRRITLRRADALPLALALVLVAAASVLAAGETTVTDKPPATGVTLELIADAWPALPRVLGYEFNQKNHHDAPSFDGGSESTPVEESVRSGKRKRWRVVGVIARCGDSLATIEARLVNKTKGSGATTTELTKLRLGPGAEVIRFFAVRDDPSRPLRFELYGPTGDDPIAVLEKTAGPGGRTTPNPYDARFVAAELNGEQRVREGYPSFPVAIRVMNDVDRPIPGATLTLLHDQFGLIETATVDGDGRWRGRLLGGAWTAIAFGAPQDDPKAETVLRTPRACYLIKGFVAGSAAAVQGAAAAVAAEMQVEMRADQTARVKAIDADGKTVVIERLTVTPHKIAEALRFADVHARCASAFTLSLDAGVLAGALDLLTNKGAVYDLAAFVRPAEGVMGFLHASSFPGDGDLPLVFAPAKMARYIFDPPTGFGGGKSMQGTLTLLEAERQSFDFAAEDLLTVYAPPGAVRVDMSYVTRNGDRLSFVPRKIDGKPGLVSDCTPRPPFNMGIFAKVSRGIQIFMAITDGAGQIVSGLGSPGSVKAFKQNGDPLFELPLSAMAFQFPTGLERVDLKDVALEAKLRIGTESLRGRPAIEMVKRYAAHGTWAVVPRVLEAQADAFLRMVAQSCAGEKRFLGGPGGPVGMDFEIFLPPGVGGTGGGGVIQLEIGDLLSFVHETDRLPGAYCHELGHNVGFGHDPYMLLAPTGVQEGMYGALGYKMQNGATLQGLFKYLESRRHQDQGTWELGNDLFGGMRLLYGPEVHRKMFEAQHGFENALRTAGLSSIERIATLYTLAVGENVAWLFRAYGWPVFDFRVNWGRQVALTRGRGVEPLNPDVAQLAALRRFWMQQESGGGENGENVSDGGESKAGGVDADPPWQPITWPTDFIALDQGKPASDGDKQYRLFARIVVPGNTIAYMVAASDVALELRLNGHAVARLDASPQLAQPVHDELMLDKKRAFPVLLMAGENTVEVDALQPPGSKGFIVGFCSEDGRPLPVKLHPAGPDLDAPPVEEKRLKPVDPVCNAGFEDGGAWPAGWIVGPGEPQGGIVPTLDGENPGGGGLPPGAGPPGEPRSPAPGGNPGGRSLRMTVTRPGTGAVMQRVVLEPGAVYRVRAKLRTDQKWDGDAYVSLFVGEVNSPMTRTEPVKQIGPRWIQVEGRFAAAKRRVVYVCCFVKARAGVVWFDDVELIREK